MNVFNFLELNGFTVKLLIVTVIVMTAELLLKKFGKKLPAFVVNYLPLIIAFIAEFIAESVVNGDAIAVEEILCGGLMAYSIGTLAAVWLKKLFRGEIEKEDIIPLVRSLIQNLCRENSVAAITEIVKLLQNPAPIDSLKENLTKLLKKWAKSGVSDKEIDTVADEILLSAKRLKEK